MKIMREEEVVTITKMSKDEIEPLEAVGLFPRRIKLTSRIDGWIDREIHDFLKNKKLIKSELIAEKIPSQLENLADDLCLLPVKKYPPCVYFMVKSGEVFYIGQSINLLARIGYHAAWKDYDAIFYLPCEKKDLSWMEGAFIRILKPIGNGDSGPICSDHEKEKIFQKLTIKRG